MCLLKNQKSAISSLTFNPSPSSMCIVAKRNVSSFEPLWCPLCQLSVSTQPATVEPLLYCLSLQSSNSYSGSVEAIESTESLPYGLQAFLFQYFLGVLSSPFHSRDHVLHAVCPFEFICPPSLCP